MILFLGLRARESEELYHRTPVFEGARSSSVFSVISSARR